MTAPLQFWWTVKKPFNPAASCYCLVLNQPGSRRVEVGALGGVEWSKPWLYYVGRASHGWGSRFKRFTRPEQRNFWHIDYLVNAPGSTRWGVFIYETQPDRECDISQTVGTMDTEPLMAGFGASDCEADCRSHGWVSERSPDSLKQSFQSATPSPEGLVRFVDGQCEWARLP